ncbi:MAG: diaminopimelate epimerase [Planctomycetes bacterium]|nr:diaminopimelate epimerase [Planctomycetota bacterium]
MRFVKMQGAGNDYVYVNCSEEEPESPNELARRISDRHFGVGADGLILVCSSAVADFKMRIFNADGSEPEMCGNGVRCFAKYVYDRGLTGKETMRIETLAGIVKPDLVVEDGRVVKVRVNMGRPRLQRSEIPMAGGEGRCIGEPLEVGGETFRITAVSMGNPHVVIFVDDVETAPVAQLGPQIENHPAFPERTNVHFVQVLSPGQAIQRTWERGSGETLACGTGAAATLVAGCLNEKLRAEAVVRVAGGVLDVVWSDDDNVYLTGPAVTVFEGDWHDPQE